MSYDFEHIWTLIQIAEKAQAHPNLKNITAAAASELDAIANPPVNEIEGQAEVDSNETAVGEASNGRRV